MVSTAAARLRDSAMYSHVTYSRQSGIFRTRHRRRMGYRRLRYAKVRGHPNQTVLT
jgi:hypothetical protein